MAAVPFLFGLIAAALFVASSLPQAIKIWRADSAAGVSIPMWTLQFALMAAWLGYALRAGNPTLLMANIGGLTTCGIVLIAIARARQMRMWAVLLAMSGLLVVLSMTTRVLPLPILTVVFLASTAIPWMQPVTSFRTLRSGGSSDVSIATYAIRGLSQVAWLGQTIYTHDAILVMTALMTLIAAAVTIGLELVISARTVRAEA
jgi:uncharacterized protein with PQ loop repeat